VHIRETGATFGGEVPENDEIDLDTPRGRAQRADRSAAIRKKTHFLFLGQEVGYGYWDSPIVVPDGSRHYAEEHGLDDPVYVYVPNARPGARAPHAWVARAATPSERTPREHDDRVHLVGGFETSSTPRDGRRLRDRPREVSTEMKFAAESPARSAILSRHHRSA